METTIKQKLREFFSGQIAWLVIVIGLTALFIFNEMQAIRLFSGIETEDWKPTSSNHSSQRATIHHK